MISVLFTLTVFVTRCFAFSLRPLYVLPKDPVLYKNIDQSLQLCDSKNSLVCLPFKIEKVKCTVEFLDSEWESSSQSIRRLNSHIFSLKPLKSGLYRIVCQSIADIKVLDETKLVLSNSDSFLDCSSTPWSVQLRDEAQIFRLCVRHIPVESSWLRAIPKLQYFLFFSVDCTCNSTALVLKEGVAYIPSAQNFSGGKFLITCSDEEFSQLIYIFDPPIKPVSMTRLASTTQGIEIYAKEPRKHLFFNETTQHTFICALLRVDDTESASPKWQRLTGQERFHIKPELSGTPTHTTLVAEGGQGSLKPSTFRCLMNFTKGCRSKILLFSRVRTIRNIRFEPLDRLQYFDEKTTCVSDGMPPEHEEKTVQVLLSFTTFWRVSGPSVSWPSLNYESQRLLLGCVVTLTYLGEIVSYQREEFFTHITSALQISFYPDRTVFWQHENMTCKTPTDDPRFQPYMIIVDYPDGFEPQIRYTVLSFEDFIPGQYEVKCYFFPPSTGKRVIARNIHVAVPPTKLTAEQYINKAGISAMRCLENGYPKSQMKVRWVIPDSLWCCSQVGNDLVISSSAIYGQYHVRCVAELRHPLATLNMSLDTYFGALGPVFAAHEEFEQYKMKKQVTRVLLRLLWAAAYLITLMLLLQLPWLDKKHTATDEEPYAFVDIAVSEIPGDIRESLRQLFRKYESVSELVGKLVRASKLHREMFVIRGFKWSRHHRRHHHHHHHRKTNINEDHAAQLQLQPDHLKASLFFPHPSTVRPFHRPFSILKSSSLSSSFVRAPTNESKRFDVAKPDNGDESSDEADRRQTSVKQNAKKNPRRKAVSTNRRKKALSAKESVQNQQARFAELLLKSRMARNRFV